MRYGGFWRRLPAYLIDLTIVTVIIMLAAVMVMVSRGLSWPVIQAYLLQAVDEVSYFMGLLEGGLVALAAGGDALDLFWAQANNVFPGDLYPTFSQLVFDSLIVSILFAFYAASFECSKLQATPGKLLFNLKVVALDGKRVHFWQAFNRNLMKVVSDLTLGMGHLMIGFTRRRQGLHDKATGCLVTLRNKSSMLDSYPCWY